MELCKETLSDNIVIRNSTLKKDNYKFLKENELEILKTFNSICLALDHIHNKEDLIHRNLKPKNIFFSFDDKLKVGDFGLATTVLSKYIVTPSPIKSKPSNILSFDSFNLNLIENKNLSHNVDYVKENSMDYFNIISCYIKDEETEGKNIGTHSYAAPEQLNNNKYDKKVYLKLIFKG